MLIIFFLFHMSIIGNVLWILLGGLIVAVLYFIAGLILCCTIIGIPFGLQLMKIALVALFPFGRDVEIMKNSGCLTIGFNILWVVFGWWEIAVVHLIFACILALTIIGIPFAKAHWRLMKMSFLPFGSGRT